MPFITRKNVLLALLALAITGVYWFFPVTAPSGVSWHQRAAYRTLQPFALFWRKTAGATGSLYRNYLHLSAVQKENQKLKQEIKGLNIEVLRLKEAERLLASYRKLSSLAGNTAEVVGYDPISPFRSITINKGLNQGVREDMGVLADGALLGRVVRVGPGHAQVLLITDPDHAVDVIDERSRARGILVGLKKNLELKRERWLTKAEYFTGAEEVKVGDLLLTSGMDGVFPKGIPVGEIRSIEKDPGGLFWQAEVEPRAELTKLEEVLVLVPNDDESSS